MPFGMIDHIPIIYLKNKGLFRFGEIVVLVKFPADAAHGVLAWFSLRPKKRVWRRAVQGNHLMVHLT
ncbi:hypothetical protein LF95_09630 [Thalassospira sp. TSL5-1]|nr:hypothetical protein LF95_09630 [Thalassospira sp. TSL5-1]